MNRVLLILAVGLGVSVVGARDLKAQRSGFIIGLGLGAGVTSYSISGFGSGNGSNAGLATDFKIGAQVSKSLQIYYLGRTNWSDDGRGNTVAAGISALGVTYVLPSAPVHLSGGIGLASWLPICFECSPRDGFGFGLTGGVSWEFADPGLLDFAVTYGRPSASGGGHVNMFLASVGISILSH